MKRAFILIAASILLLAAGAALGAVGIVVYFGQSFAQDVARTKMSHFFNQAYSLKRLQEGSSDEAIHFLRSSNELALLAVASEPKEQRLRLAVSHADTIAWVCKDLQSSPAGDEKTQRMREEVTTACLELGTLSPPSKWMSDRADG